MKDKIIELYMLGYPTYKIAVWIGISEANVVRILECAGLIGA